MTTVTKGIALFVSVTLAGAWAQASGSASPPAASPKLVAISSRAHSKGATLTIEASVPVPYVTTQPDPLTVLLDFRNVSADIDASAMAASAKSPIASISVEPADSAGSPAARVRVTLTWPVGYRVRSARNTVVVDFDKPSGKTGPFVMRPVVRQSPPDGMLALAQVPAPDPADPIVALGLDAIAASVMLAPAPMAPSPTFAPAPALPVLVPAPSPPAPPARQPVVNQAHEVASGTSASADTPRAVQTAPVPAPSVPPPPVPPSRVQDVQTSPRGGGRQYTGHPISLDFQGADLRSVLRVFSEVSGLNIVIDPMVTGTVDVALREVPWDQALDIILRANKLGYIVDGTIVRIAPLSELAEEETQKRKLSDEQALAGELRVFTRSLSYAKAEEMQALLTKSALSRRGTVQVDPRTNTLIVTDLADRLTTASDLITTLDRPQPQVEIEARIVQTNKSYARELGIQWGFAGRVDPQTGNTTNLAFPNNGSIGERTGSTQQPIVGGTGTQVPTVVNLPPSAATSAIGLQLGSINGAFNLDVALSALESSGNGRLLSTPRVTMQNNFEAEVTQGVQIPIQTVSNNTTVVSFKDAALTLKVTPQITSANTVIMKISVENGSPDFSRAINGIPPINTQRANTQVLVSDGQTTVIGGIYISTENATIDKTPGLSRVPLLKWLFRRESVKDSSTELLIFVTPRIIKG